MIRALWTAASGMSAQQLNVDIISNNLANVNTNGYKKARAEFQDLFYQTIQEPQVDEASGRQVPVGLQVGMGTRPVAVQKMFSQGEHQQTDNPMDFAIEGNGFFQVKMKDDTIGYTRSGAFKIDGTGQMVNSEGNPLEPSIVIPENATSINISADGVVSVKLPGQTDSQTVGTIELAQFLNPAGLKSLGHNLYEVTVASGAPRTGAPGVDGNGQLLQGALEMSNVRVVDEMVQMIMAQRSYEINSKAIQTADEMIRIANNIRA
ncbi:MAG: flagellar basal-body rod protein FlgG [Elusimicrobiota bacterium]